MRCVDVARELSVPTGRLAPAELARHVCSCPRCAATEQRLRRLDRAWGATRPDSPPPAAWDQVWANVLATSEARPLALAQTETETQTRTRSAPGTRRWLAPTLTAVVFAQAAAILIAFSLPRPWSATDPTPTSPAAAANVDVVFELETGQTLFLELDEHGGQVVCKPRFLDTAELAAFNGEDGPDHDAVSFQADLLVLNVMEGLE